MIERGACVGGGDTEAHRDACGAREVRARAVSSQPILIDDECLWLISLFVLRAFWLWLVGSLRRVVTAC